MSVCKIPYYRKHTRTSLNQEWSFRQRMHGIHCAAAVLYPDKSVLFQHGFRAYADGMTSRIGPYGHIITIIFTILLLFATTLNAQDNFNVTKPKIQFIELPIGLSVGTTTKNLFPHPLLDTPNFNTGLVLRPITAFDENRDIVCRLCKSPPKQLDDQTIRIVLKKGMTWGDGTPLTSYDLVFTWQAALSQPPVTENLKQYHNIKDLVAEDNRKLRLVWHSPPYKTTDLSFFWPIAKHVERFAMRKPLEYSQKTRYTTDLTDPGLYNGPYRPGSISEEDDKARFIRNTNFKGPYPKIDEVVVKRLPDKETLHTVFKEKRDAGFKEFDYKKDAAKYQNNNRYVPTPGQRPVFLGTSLILPDEIETQTLLDHPETYEVLKNPKTGAKLVYLESDTPLPEPIKQALKVSLDTSSMLKLGLAEKFTIADRIFPMLPNETIPVISVEEAMQQAGFEKTQGLWSKAGQPFTIGFKLERTVPWRGFIQQLAVNDWRDAGFVVDIVTDDEALVSRQKAKDNTYNLSLRTYAIPTGIDPDSFENADKVVIPLFYEPTIYGFTGKLEGLKITASPVSLWAENWYIKRPSRFE